MLNSLHAIAFLQAKWQVFVAQIAVLDFTRVVYVHESRQLWAWFEQYWHHDIR
ncbi:hypothetical protein JYQ62_19370 [Nostoc sp. UHCC 0702]|nr:hypothetical protein JYQ62_19370 [Nostoc sp. UHCC 0702]